MEKCKPNESPKVVAKIVNFADGPSEASIGQDVVYSNGQSGHHFRLGCGKITAIGTKYITVEDRTQFGIVDGIMKTNYSAGRVYSSQAAYERVAGEAKVIDEVKTQLRDFTLRLTYEQAVKIKAVLNDEPSENLRGVIKSVLLVIQHGGTMKDVQTLLLQALWRPEAK